MSVRINAFAVVLAVALISSPGLIRESRAECDGPYPSFREAAPSAAQLVIGDVVAVEPVEWMEPDGRSSRFTLHGWSLREGGEPVVIPIRDLQSQPCAGYLIARAGDRVAIAFNGRAFSTRVAVNAIAWIDGQPPGFIGDETVTIAEVFQLAGLEAPAAFPPKAPAEGGDSGVPWLPLAAAIGLLLACAAVLRRIVA